MFILCLSHHCFLAAGKLFTRFTVQLAMIASLGREGWRAEMLGN